jgi:hypothetical protein
MNELKEDFNKHQSETQDTIKKEIYELKMTTQNIKEEIKKDLENLRKMNQTNPRNKKFSYPNKKHSGRSIQQSRARERQSLRA